MHIQVVILLNLKGVVWVSHIIFLILNELEGLSLLNEIGFFCLPGTDISCICTSYLLFLILEITHADEAEGKCLCLSRID